MKGVILMFSKLWVDVQSPNPGQSLEITQLIVVVIIYYNSNSNNN